MINYENEPSQMEYIPSACSATAFLFTLIASLVMSDSSLIRCPCFEVNICSAWSQSPCIGLFDKQFPSIEMGTSFVMNAKYSFCFGPFGMPSVNGVHSLPAANDTLSFMT